jgi:two-component system, cell cycle response regulator CpdR
MAHILVADDDPQILALMNSFLTARGHRIATACDGAQALVLFEAGSFDLVLSDVMMPEMDGIALARALGVRAPGLPVLLMTGYAAGLAQDATLEGLVRGVILKPFSLKDIAAAIDAALAAPPR